MAAHMHGMRMGKRMFLAGLILLGPPAMTVAQAQEHPPETEALESGEFNAKPTPEDTSTYPEDDATEGKPVTIEELRVGAFVRGYRIEPRRGLPYYLHGFEADDRFDRFKDDELDSPGTAQWELLRWKRKP